MLEQLQTTGSCARTRLIDGGEGIFIEGTWNRNVFFTLRCVCISDGQLYALMKSCGALTEQFVDVK